MDSFERIFVPFDFSFERIGRTNDSFERMHSFDDFKRIPSPPGGPPAIVQRNPLDRPSCQGLGQRGRVGPAGGLTGGPGGLWRPHLALAALAAWLAALAACWRPGGLARRLIARRPGAQELRTERLFVFVFVLCCFLARRPALVALRAALAASWRPSQWPWRPLGGLASSLGGPWRPGQPLAALAASLAALAASGGPVWRPVAALGEWWVLPRCYPGATPVVPLLTFAGSYGIWNGIYGSIGKQANKRAPARESV